MRFQVPQFIETEEKIFGPFTLKQFFWVLGAVVTLFISFVSGGLLVTFLVGVPIASIFMALGFIKIGGMVLFMYVYYAIKHYFKPKRYYYKSDGGKTN